MIDLPEITDEKISSDKVILSLYIDKKLNAFEGHFDETPIIPGVVQIQWALGLTKKYFSSFISKNIARIDALKFQHVIQPGLNVFLELAVTDDKIIFSYYSDSAKHSSGKLVVE
ncbi:ApeI family dehydratase [Aliikangiella sp. IMCC44359]|uniref:ApeI family dehydratase n=1 Tax=Aliikangiella sp. IMCC44359 TaxID=3459125 RepID=UPI00403A9306